MKLRLEAILYSVYFAIICFFLLSCNPQKKAVNYFNKHPELSAKFCADKYPVKDSIGEPIIKYVPADNKDHTEKIDSLNRELKDLRSILNKQTSFNTLDECLLATAEYRSKINRLSDQLNKLKNDYEKCKPDTQYKEVPIYRENTAKLTALNNELNKVKLERDEYISCYTWTRNLLIGVSILSLVLLFFTVRK